MDENRPSRESIYMATAYLWARRSLCKRAAPSVGCVITTSNLRSTLAHGYNGPPKKMPNNSCRNGEGSCGCSHAEANAIALVDGTIPDKILFVTREPCEFCANLIAQAGIAKVYYCDEYRNHLGLERLQACGIQIYQMIPPHFEM